MEIAHLRSREWTGQRWHGIQSADLELELHSETGEVTECCLKANGAGFAATDTDAVASGSDDSIRTPTLPYGIAAFMSDNDLSLDYSIHCLEIDLEGCGE